MTKIDARRELAAALDSEFRRLARQEGKSMGELVSEVARCIGVGERHLYRYRSGQWPIPAELLPALCRRFNSRALMVTLENHLSDLSVIDLLQGTDYTGLALSALRQATDLVDNFVAQWARRDHDRIALNRLQETTFCVIARFRALFALLESNYESRTPDRSDNTGQL